MITNLEPTIITLIPACITITLVYLLGEKYPDKVYNHMGLYLALIMASIVLTVALVFLTGLWEPYPMHSTMEAVIS